MTDRVLTALRSLGIEGTPAAALEQENAFFVLLDDMLIYQDPQGTRRVTLRDLTRIHSDQGGLLRVETPAGTALTASLLGFDPAQVQPFFAQVRDATARAKNLPGAPLPTSGGLKTFGSAPRPAIVLGEAPAVGAVPEAPATTGSAAPPAPATVRPVRSGGLPPERAGEKEEKAAVTVVAVNSSARAAALAAPSTPAPGASSVTPPAAPPSPATPTAAAPLPGLLPALAERANAVHGLVSRLRLLAAVLGLAAVGLAVFQYLDGTPLQGLWTLIAGGVGAIALLIFADVTRLIVALARAVAEGRRPDMPGSPTSSPGTSSPDASRG